MIACPQCNNGEMEFEHGAWMCSICNWEPEDLYNPELYNDEKVAPFYPREPYAEYLKTERWKTLAEAVKSLAEGRCRLCGTTANLHAHHRSYKRLKTPDEIRDLIAICKICHNKFHRK